MILPGVHPRIALVSVPLVIEFDLGSLTFLFATANDFLEPELQYRVEVVSSSLQPYIKGVSGLEFSNRHPYSTVRSNRYSSHSWHPDSKLSTAIACFFALA